VPSLPASPWIQRFASLIRPAGTVLDVACGEGRHTRFMLGRGHSVTAVDRDMSAVSIIAGAPGLEFVQADLEGEAAWPFHGRRFAGVIVTNYLHRPILPDIVAAVGPGGALLYETFAIGNERFGKPSNPDFLLQPGELLEAVRGRLVVRAYEHLEIDEPRPAMVQRIAATDPG
jgi:SAM-dependent methyltransferase